MTENNNRAVITGLGMICAIGNSVDEAWNNAINSVSGIHKTTTLDTTDCYADLAAEVKCDTLGDFEGSEDADRSAQLCIKAAGEAMKDAGLDDFAGDPKASVIIGSCVGGAVSISDYYEHGKKASDVTKMPISSIAPQVAGQCHAGGVVTNIANACAAGTISIAYACELIRAGKADVVLAGGSDTFAAVPYAGFLSLHALDADGCSPFNRCTGITLGEGSGVVVVESYEHAKARNAKMYCEVLGAGVSSDAHHITAPRPDGEGQMEAINRAIKNSGLKKSDIGYVNAHGTGTAKNDDAEFLSLHTIFDGENNNLSVSSTKAMTGHCLGAAGAIEAVFSIKALTTNTVVPTLGFKDEDMDKLAEKAGKIDFCPNKAHKKELTSVMNNSFAFGGNNASIIFSKEAGNVTVKEEKKPLVITGIGVVTPSGNGVDTYVANAVKNEALTEANLRSSVGKEDYDALGLKMSFYRKLDNFSQLQAVSGMEALKDADYAVTDDNATDIGIIVGTSEGALGTCCDFQSMITEKGNASGSAFKFPNTVYNAAGGYLSICSGIKGYNVTVTNGAQSGLASMAYAMSVLRSGQENAMLATGSDENSDIMTELFGKLGVTSEKVVAPFAGNDGFVLSDGSASVLIEDEKAAKERGARIYCHAAGYGMAHSNVKFGTLTGSEAGLTNAVNNALADAGMTIDDIDAVFGFANGMKAVDDVEIKGLTAVFGDKLAEKPVVELKEVLGESRAAAATTAAAHAALMFAGKIPSQEAYSIAADGSVSKTNVEASKLNNVLVAAYGAGGSYTAIVLSK